MDLSSTILIAMATWQIVDVWFHGRLFAWLHCRVRHWPVLGYTLAVCPYCCSIVTAVALAFAWQSHWIVATAIAGVAASKAANLLNDLTSSVNKIPRWTCAEQTEYEASKHGEDSEVV